MKSSNKLKQWLMLLLCVVMTAGAFAQTAGAATPTDKCLNPNTQGIEYFAPMSTLAEDANKWRGDLEVYATLENGTPVGEVTAVELEVINSGTRYQCTESQIEDQHFSCNSMPTHSVISGVYIWFKPTGIAVDTPVFFHVRDANAFKKDGITPEDPFWATSAKVKLPPYPCAINIFTKDFVAPSGTHLVFYTETGCSDGEVEKDDVNKVKTLKQTREFLEQKDRYAIVNIIEWDTLLAGELKIEGNTIVSGLDKSRFVVDVDPRPNFDFTMVLYFKDYDGKEYPVKLKYEWDPDKKVSTRTITADSELNGMKNDKLPLTLIRGEIKDLKTKETDGWGNADFPPDIDMSVQFWYENTEGTLGFENSIFHFERNLNIQFAPTCSSTAPAATLYDPCQSTTQGFVATLKKPFIIYQGDSATTWNVTLPYGTGNSDVKMKPSDGKYNYNTSSDAGVVKWLKDHKMNTDGFPFYFVTRKCVNASCDWVTGTSAYPRTINFADGGGSNHTYSAVGRDHNTRTQFRVKPYGTKEHPFAITSLTLVADEPGTYVIYPFTKYADGANSLPTNYFTGPNGGPIYVTVNDKDQLDTCSSLANNGYFKALWNDCLSPSETQLLTFEHIPGKEEAWMENRSNHGVYFPYVQEWSYLPQAFQIASLTYKAEALAGGGRPGEAYCTPAGCYVPPYTRVFITGGTMYFEGYPKFDNYYVAYARQDTWNISHLFFSVQVKECKSKKIPDTGISLRSPLKVDPKVDAATSYAFTGNRLQIPAIGLGVGAVPPLPIVHVYYEDGSENMKWDLSTLGNYVGELEGGSYIPYGGNSVLTGHFWSQGVFVNLKNLNYEDEVIIYGNDGIKYTYKVVEKFIAQPEEVYEMFQQVGERSLTLVTCENYNLNTDEYERRYIVRAVIDSQEPYEMNW